MLSGSAGEQLLAVLVEPGVEDDQPYSRMNPQFNREVLKECLRGANIKYVFLGRELGARSDDRSCYRNGRIQYDLLAATELFRHGISRVEEGANTHCIALMCAEKEPLECHRTILVARKLHDDGLSVKHILADGCLEDHEATIGRLITSRKGGGVDMFRSKEAIVADAYARQAEQIAYREQKPEADNSDPSPPRHASGVLE
jgi:hypothetical protein